MRGLLFALLLLTAPADAWAADTQIAQPRTNQIISAHGGRVAWSEDNRLMTWANGVVSQVPVDPQAGGFDVNLGRGPAGATVAVYSRENGLYLFDFAKGTESRLGRLSKPGTREQGPVIDRELIVFFRGNATRRGLYVGSLRDGTIRRIPRLPREIGPYDFQGRRLAYTVGKFADDQVRFIDELFVHDVVTGRRRGLARVSSGLMSSSGFAGTSFAGSFVHAARTRRGAPGNRFLKIDVRNGRVREVVGRQGIVEAAFDGDRAVYLATQGEECSPCTLSLTPPLF
jgi:hypothetical protein